MSKQEVSNKLYKEILEARTSYLEKEEQIESEFNTKFNEICEMIFTKLHPAVQHKEQQSREGILKMEKLTEYIQDRAKAFGSLIPSDSSQISQQ